MYIPNGRYLSRVLYVSRKIYLNLYTKIFCYKMEIKEIFMKTKVSNLLIAAALMLIATDLYAQPKLVDADSKIEYAIEWHLNGGTQNPSNTYTYTAEDGLVLATPVREGYTFDGWFEKDDLSGSKVTEIKKGETQKKIFYAGWIITKEQAIKIMKEEMVTVIPSMLKAPGKYFTYQGLNHIYKQEKN